MRTAGRNAKLVGGFVLTKGKTAGILGMLEIKNGWRIFDA
jgi:hypothetical protein